MNATEQAADLLAAQECESLSACIARGQSSDTYQDIVGKIRGHLERLPSERKSYWTNWCSEVGVILYPPEPPKKGGKSSKLEATSPPST